MQKRTNMDLLIRSSLALVLALAIGHLSACAEHRLGTGPAVGSPAQSQSAETAEGKNMAEAKMMERCREMKEQKQKMKEDMKAQDAELTEQIAKMNSAPKDKKMSLMAAVITRMVEQRIIMDARKAKMEEEMMKHMMQHMQMGKESMSQCPMMKEMKGMDESPAGAHKEHQKK
jgi:hypothetical protein